MDCNIKDADAFQAPRIINLALTVGNIEEINEYYDSDDYRNEIHAILYHSVLELEDIGVVPDAGSQSHHVVKYLISASLPSGHL